MVTRIGLFLPVFLPLAASPAAAQEADPTGMWEGRWVSEVRHFVEGEGAPRQLFHNGAVEARFEFCVAEDGTIVGTGSEKVTRNGSAELERIEPNGDRTNCSYKFSPTEAEVSLKVMGQVRGNDFWLFLAPDNVEMQTEATCHYRPANFPPWSNTYSQSAPTAGHGILVSTPGNPLLTGFTIAAQDGADREAEGFDTYPAGWDIVPGFAEYRNRVQIRRPKKDTADELPILLGQVFEPENAHVSPEGEKSLEMVLPQMRCNPGRTRIRIVTGGEAAADELFLEALNRARRDQLSIWLREHGIDPSRIGWSRSGGPEDDVQVKFGR